jgi:serine/threonine protein kinase/Tfp pilus assembly protein PilF
MNVSAGRRTWEEANSPAAVRLAQQYEQAWRDASHPRHRPRLDDFLAQSKANGALAARLALLRADMSLKWESGEKVSADWYLNRYATLTEDEIVALVYEEFCLREENRECPLAAEFLSRFPQVAEPLGRVLQIHDLVGSGTTTASFGASFDVNGKAGDRAFPEAGQTIAGFRLVEELGRGSFARVFLAQERQLADRLVAIKVTRKGSREPQTLARLQHTHIVPVHSHRIDTATGLHLLCMPYFGRITLARVLADPVVAKRDSSSGVALVEALDRLEKADVPQAAQSAGRSALCRRTFPRAIAWWGARLADALQHAHERGVLHRDIKPSNVLVTADGMPMLLDFNLAREPVLEEGAAGGSAALGGTIDYMAPEHLQALAEGSSVGVDARADIYGLGMVLYEALCGHRPFAASRKGASVAAVLSSAAAERRRPLPALRRENSAVPPALDVVVRRCLEPDPQARYASAAELAADLQAVADDQPLSGAKESWRYRLGGWVRRRRRPLTTAAVVITAITAILMAVLSVQLDRLENRELGRQEYDAGVELLKRGDYLAAKSQFDSVLRLTDRYETGFTKRLAQLKNPASLGRNAARLVKKFRELNSGAELIDIQQDALQMSELAARYAQVHHDADKLFQAADALRFRLLLSEDDELLQAIRDLKMVIEPFYVLENPNWTKLDFIVEKLDDKLRNRLINEVNELLFLWVAAIDELLGKSSERAAPSNPKEAEGVVDRAVSICDRALAFAESKGPWETLRTRLLSRRAAAAAKLARGSDRGSAPFLDLRRDVALETSALACFQWGLLCYRDGRQAGAIDWLQRAVRLKGDNYWHQYFLGFVEDQAGLTEAALGHYNVAAALKPGSPWVRFSRARIHRAKGRWGWAIDDLKFALDAFRGRPEINQARLELGYLYQELGDYAQARREYGQIIDSGGRSDFVGAALLNLAYLDAESGNVALAFESYEQLLQRDPNDTAARHSRALLELRLGHAEAADAELSQLLDSRVNLKNREEVLAARALARLVCGHAELAMADAKGALALRPCPSYQRLWQRAVLAARRVDCLQLDRPEEIWQLPLGGRRLEVDLAAAAAALSRIGSTEKAETFRASLCLAVILAALGRPEQALAAADHGLAVSSSSPRAHLIRARVRTYAGDLAGAREDIEQGLRIQFDEPGLLELRGALAARLGQPSAAIDDFNKAMFFGALDRIHIHKANALADLGQFENALNEWSLALRRDPELPEAFLGRALVHMRLGRWEMALADLEQAAAWAHSDPRIELLIAAAYWQCVRNRPDRFPRWLSLAKRTAKDAWNGLVERLPRKSSGDGKTAPTPISVR